MTRVEAIKRAEKFPKHTMCILSKTLGDKEFSWDPSDEGGVAVAEREFNAARGMGMTGFLVGQDGQGSEVISEFDPTADAIVVAPQIIGG